MSLSAWAARVTGRGDPTDDGTREPSVERFAFTNPGRLTLVLLALCVVVSAFTLIGAPFPLALSYRLDMWGAKVNEAVAKGEWWRLLASAFLHGSWMHLILNSYALFVVGTLVEHSYGRARMLAIYVLSALTGSLASLAFTDGSSVGASGAIFGLLGASFLILKRGRQHMLTVVSSRTLSGLGLWALNSIASGFTHSGIDNAAHFGGLAGGFVVAALLPEGRAARFAASLCVVALSWTGLMMDRSVSRESTGEWHFEQGMHALEHGDTALATRELTAASRHPMALFLLASVHEDAMQHEKALAELDTMLAVGCQGEICKQAQLLRANVLLELSHPEEAVVAARAAATSADPESRERAIVVQAGALHELHRNAEAIDVAKEARKATELSTARLAHDLRASAFSELGRHVEAAAEYADAAEAEPANAEPWLSARIEYLAAGDSEFAVRSGERAVAAAQRAVDSTRGTNATQLRLLGTALRVARRCPEAKSAFERAASLTTQAAGRGPRRARPAGEAPPLESRGGSVAVWTDSQADERGIVIRVKNLSGHRMTATKILLLECSNVRETCDVPFDPCFDLSPGGTGELWVYQLDRTRSDSFRYHVTWHGVP